MTAPKHLWSGDWRSESERTAETAPLSRGRTDTPADPPPAETPGARPVRETPAPPAAAPRGSRGPRTPRMRSVVIVAIATMLSALLAYAIVSALVSADSQSTAQIPPAGQQASTVSTGTAWLGVETTSFPLTSGAMITDVAHGSPADAAGLEPGDIITGIDSGAVQTPADLDSALAGMHPGQQVQIGYDRGGISLTAEATLGSQPNSP